MPTRARTRAFVVATLFLAIHQGPLVAEFPRPSGYVNDFASVLTEDHRVYLETFLQAVERDTTAKVVLATVTSLEGLTIEEYASRCLQTGASARGRETTAYYCWSRRPNDASGSRSATVWRGSCPMASRGRSSGLPSSPSFSRAIFAGASGAG
jgi:TPM domain